MKTFKQYLEEKDPCWKGYRQLGTKKKDGKEVPNCIPESEEHEEMHTKEEAKYQDQPKNGNKCSQCEMWVAPNKCEGVSGKISPNGWCVYFEKEEDGEKEIEEGDGFYLEVGDTLIEATVTEVLSDGIVISLDDIAFNIVNETYILESEYQGRKVPLNKPMKGDVKKSKVYVKGPSGRVVKVNFGDKNLSIKKHIPARRRSFRARHNCENPGPKHKARYWSCKAW